MNKNNPHSFIPRTGIDIVDTVRIKKAIERHGEKFLKRIYTRSEIDYCSKKSNPYPSYAARFAAKEAVMKALGKGLYDICFCDIEVTTGDSGRPEIYLLGGAKACAEQVGIESIDVSLSHERSMAVAVVFALADSKKDIPN
ncbi:Holo-[acyl-carrier-protein] synthase [hydrothermal vent metagenome]|uniref:Holo-[acyl-carrier-protein] synthase n=1 Tax=hydrothermal vent metagenome TaxID=652676 RepID=A0A3B1BSM1_9ZZZZ